VRDKDFCQDIPHKPKLSPPPPSQRDTPQTRTQRLSCRPSLLPFSRKKKDVLAEEKGSFIVMKFIDRVGREGGALEVKISVGIIIEFIFPIFWIRCKIFASRVGTLFFNLKMRRSLRVWQNYRSLSLFFLLSPLEGEGQVLCRIRLPLHFRRKEGCEDR